MNRRLYSLMTLGVATLLGATLFLTSEKVQRTGKELALIEEKVAIEKDSLRVLNAEWAYLNRPDRLEQLATSYLHLSPSGADKLTATIEALPETLSPVRPGIKPASIAAGSIQTNTSFTSEQARSDTGRRPLPATTSGFNQLIDPLAIKSKAP